MFNGAIKNMMSNPSKELAVRWDKLINISDGVGARFDRHIRRGRTKTICLRIACRLYHLADFSEML